MPRIELCRTLYWLRGALCGPIELEKGDTHASTWVPFAWLLMVGAMAYGASLIHFVDIPSVLVTVVAGHAPPPVSMGGMLLGLCCHRRALVSVSVSQVLTGFNLGWMAGFSDWCRSYGAGV